MPVFCHRGGVETCGRWAEFYNAILLEVKLDPSSLSRFSDMADGNKHVLDNCTYCWKRVEWLKLKIAGGISAIPRFSEIKI
jgi:hypothetical protein